MSAPPFDIATPLSDLLETTLKEGPQVISKDGVDAAVIVSIAEWKRIQSAPEVHSASSSPDPRLDPLTDPNGPHDIHLP